VSLFHPPHDHRRPPGAKTTDEKVHLTRAR
jgi:hypothetical protein